MISPRYPSAAQSVRPDFSLVADRRFARRLGWILAIVAASAVLGGGSTAAQALITGMAGQSGAVIQQQNGVVGQMPLNFPMSRKNGLAMSIDTRWANNYGYRPIEVTVTSRKPTTTDHLITIRIHTSWWSSQGGSISVEQDFEMPQGSTSASTLVSFPQYQLFGQFYWWEVWIDGMKDKDLSRDKKMPLTSPGTGTAPGGGSGLSVLAVGPTSQRRCLVSPNSQRLEVLSLPAKEFPRRWIDYTCFDVVVLSRAELELAAQANPDALVAIRRWVEAGGQLWISNTGANWEHLGDVAKYLGVPATLIGLNKDTVDKADDREKSALDEVTTEDSSSEGAWRPVRFGSAGPLGRVVTFLNLNDGTVRVARDQTTIDELQKDPTYTISSQEFQPEAEGTPPRWPSDSSRWFVDQPLGLGSLRAFRGEPGSTLLLSAQLNAVADPNANEEATNPRPSPLGLALRATRHWDARHGLKPDDANMDFATLLVPDVGLAPVTEFRVLITLFVLLIGPVNYWLLKRVGRLHLLVLTVPLAAALLTSALFGYAILSDGFDTSVRAQTVTTLDQRTGDAACWSRLSYYAGLAPSQGLTMPDDVVVYPIIPGWNDTNVDASIGAAREMTWGEGDAKLTRGWLRSRTPMQYLTIRARKSPHRIDLTPAADKMRAVNNLGTEVRFLLVIDKDGMLFAGENMSPESKSVLEPMKRADAIRKLRQLIRDNTPEAPPALAGEGTDFQIMQRRQSRRMMTRNYGLRYSDQRLDANLLNDALAELAGLSGQPALQLPPKSYVAITETGPEVALGIPGAEEQASFHVLVARW